MNTDTGNLLRAFASGYGFPLDTYQLDACRYVEDGSGVLVLVNASHADVDFRLPPSGSEEPWRLRLDSAEGCIDPPAELQPVESAVVVPGRSMQIYSV